jgi:3-oxoacyl-ACP reductase-like protein
MHFLACKEALMQALGGGEGEEEGQPEAPAPEAPAPEAPAPPAPEASAEKSQPPPGIGKAQLDPGESGGEKLKPISKTELDVASLFAEIETLKKGLKEKDQAIQDMETSFGQAAQGLKKLIERGSGMRKSIASVAFTPKPGSEAAVTEKIDAKSLTKSEVIGKLNKVTASPTLSKSDRDQINSFIYGNCSIEKIEKFLQ